MNDNDNKRPEDFSNSDKNNNDLNSSWQSYRKKKIARRNRRKKIFKNIKDFFLGVTVATTIMISGPRVYQRSKDIGRKGAKIERVLPQENNSSLFTTNTKKDSSKSLQDKKTRRQKVLKTVAKVGTWVVVVGGVVLYSKHQIDTKKALTEELQESKVELNTAQEGLKKAQQDYDQIVENYTKSENNLSEAKETIKDLKNQLREARQTCVSLQQRVDDLENKVDLLTKELEEKKQIEKDLRAALQQEKQTAASLLNQQEQDQKLLFELDNERQQLRIQVQNAEKATSISEENVRKLEEKIDEVQTKLEETNQEAMFARFQNMYNKSMLDSLQKEKDSNLAKIDTLEEQAALNKNRIETLTSDLRKKVADVDNRDRALGRLQDNLKESNKKYRKSQRKTDSLEVQFRQATQQLEVSEDKKAVLETVQERLKEELDAAKENKQIDRERLAKNRKEIKSLYEKLDKVSNDFSNADDNLKELSEKLYSAQEQLDETITKLDQVEQERDKARMDCQQKNYDLLQTIKQRDSAEETLKTSSKELREKAKANVRRYRQECRKLEQERDELAEKYKTLTDKFTRLDNDKLNQQLTVNRNNDKVKTQKSKVKKLSKKLAKATADADKQEEVMSERDNDFTDWHILNYKINKVRDGFKALRKGLYGTANLAGKILKNNVNLSFEVNASPKSAPETNILEVRTPGEVQLHKEVILLPTTKERYPHLGYNLFPDHQKVAEETSLYYVPVKGKPGETEVLTRAQHQKKFKKPDSFYNRDRITRRTEITTVSPTNKNDGRPVVTSLTSGALSGEIRPDIIKNTKVK